jgi:hypothetical protein
MEMNTATEIKESDVPEKNLVISIVFLQRLKISCTILNNIPN